VAPTNPPRAWQDLGVTQVDDRTAQPRLTRKPASRRRGARSRGLVLMLHGGAEHDVAEIGTLHRPWLRSLLMMRQLLPSLHRAGLDVWLLRYRHVGWNAPGDTHSPVPDARWALDRARTSYDEGERPVVLLGHSMGARTAAAVSDDPLVRGVVGLAPWFPPGEPVEPLRGKHLVAVHGRADRITSFAATEQYVARAGPIAASAELVDMGERGHYMLRGAGEWNSAARTHTLQMFRDGEPTP
jgi:predicted esterase